MENTDKINQECFVDYKHAHCLAMAQISQLMPYYGGESWMRNGGIEILSK